VKAGTKGKSAHDKAVKGRKAAIIGFANSKQHAPFDDPEVELYLLNELWMWFEGVQEERRKTGQHVPEWTAWFELHGRDVIGETKRPDTPDKNKHLDWLAAQTKPIYMQRHFPDIPASVPFPLDLLEGRFSRIPHFDRYWTSSIGFMLGLLIASGRDENWKPDGSGTHYDSIGLYGIDLAGDSEYSFQRPNAEWFSGFASGIGIEVYAHPDSALFKGECVYGYEQPPDEAGPLNRKYWEAHIKQLQAALVEHNEAIMKEQAIVNTLNGAIQEAKNSLSLLNFSKRGAGAPNINHAPIQIEVSHVG
jgi:hypothetical protein